MPHDAPNRTPSIIPPDDTMESGMSICDQCGELTPAMDRLCVECLATWWTPEPETDEEIEARADNLCEALRGMGFTDFNAPLNHAYPGDVCACGHLRAAHAGFSGDCDLSVRPPKTCGCAGFTLRTS